MDSGYRPLSSMSRFEVESPRRRKCCYHECLNTGFLIILLVLVIALVASQAINYLLIYQFSQTPIATEIQGLNLTYYQVQIKEALVSFNQTLTNLNQTLNRTDTMIEKIERYLPPGF